MRPRRSRRRTSLRFLEQLLTDRSDSGLEGDAASWTWSVDMADVFERYLERLLLDLHRRGLTPSLSRRQAQPTIGHLARQPRAFAQRPDILLRGDAGTIILDAKYKAPRGFRPSATDARQVAAYAALYNQNNPDQPCVRVLLAYPRRWDGPDPPTPGGWTLALEAGERSVSMGVIVIPFGRVPTKAMLDETAAAL